MRWMSECCIISELSLVLEQHIKEVIWEITDMFSCKNVCIFESLGYTEEFGCGKEVNELAHSPVKELAELPIAVSQRSIAEH